MAFAGNPTYSNVWWDTFRLLKVIKPGDKFILSSIKELDLPLMLHRKAAKLWSLRLEMVKKL